MYRKGKYTRKRGPVASTKQFFKRRWLWYKDLPRWKKIVYPTAPVLAFLIVVPIFTYLYYFNDIGNMDRLMNRNNTGVALMDKNGKVFYATERAQHRKLIKLDNISKDMQHALIASEDKDFYKHGGFSPLATLRALYTDILIRRAGYGGSTLTQQLAKNTLLSNNKSILRKYQELVIAAAIEQRYSKDEILDMYLNSVFFGNNSFGIEDAADSYFNKSPKELDLAESAMLVGVLPAPSAYSPITGDEKLAKERQTTVLNRMVENGYITEKEKDAALKEKLHYAKAKSPIDNAAPHFTEMILKQLYDKYGEEKVTRSGFQVKTTLDLKAQKQANKAVADNMDHIRLNGGSNASMVAVNPKDGSIKAMVGSYDYDNKDFGTVNMATTARQPGSSFKPIYYSDALASGKITPTTVLSDTAKDFDGYKPLNADRQFRGNVTVRQALNWSLNIPAVEVMQKEGISNAVTAAKNLGIKTINENKNYGLSLALGSAEVPLTQMTNAYAAFANGGEQYDSTSINSIQDKYGSTIFTRDKNSHEAISRQGAYLISNVLSDNQTKSVVFGNSLTVTGTDGQVKTAAVKTGTTDDSRDAWTIGYTPDVVVGVWVGNNDNQPMLSGGSDMAGPIWREMMGQQIGTGNPSFTQPSGITKATVCTDVGSKTDVFLSTNVPDKCSNTTKEKEDTTKDKKPKTTTKKCDVDGKETLNANDPNCKSEMCDIDGKEDLAANDPNCKEDTEPVDSDSDGVSDDDDTCPNTTAGLEVDGNGCSADQRKSGGDSSGGTGPGSGSN